MDSTASLVDPPGDATDAAAPATAPPAVAPSESAMVSYLTSLVEVSPSLKTWYEQFDIDRVYVNDASMRRDDEEAVTTNYLLRNQLVLLSNLFARDPAVSWKPGPTIGEHPPLLAEYGKTCEILCQKLAREVDLRRLLRGGIQDASTVGWQVYKLSPQEDPKRDPIGACRQDDALDNLARYQWLRRRKQAGMLDADSAAAQELADLEMVVARSLAEKVEADLLTNAPAQVPTIDPATGMPAVNPVTGEPVTQLDLSDPRIARLEALMAGQIPPELPLDEIPRYLGFNLDPIQSEDFRFDWTVPSPEMLYQGQWMAHRVFMDYDKFGSVFQIDPNEIGMVTLFGDDGRRLDSNSRWSGASMSIGGKYDSEGPTDRSDVEAQTNMGRCAVWELWNKNTGLVYTWVEGMNRFLRKEKPTVVGRRWYTFYFLPFNRVTGRALPLSDTVLTRPLQEELNRRRTFEAQAQAAAFPRIFIRKGSMTEAEKAVAESSHPYQVIELESPEDVARAFAETKPLPFNPELYSRVDTRMELEMMSGISRNAAGTGSGDLATTAAIANEQMGVQVDYRRSLLEELIYDIMYDMVYMANQFMPEENIKALCGDGAYWPYLGREQFLRRLDLDVRSGSTGRPDVEKNLKVYEVLANMAPQLGLPLDSYALLEDIMYDMGKNDWKKYLMTPQKLLQRQMAGMPLGMPQSAGPGPTAPRGNAAQPEPTPGDGRPTMAESGPPSPEQVPGPV